MKKKSRKSKMTGCLHILPSLENKNNNVCLFGVCGVSRCWDTSGCR